MAFFSIITINLNNRKGLERTLKSVAMQTFRDFEYIVVDGVSTDGSLDLLKEYASLITLPVVEKDSGIYNAMNKGLERASGKYVIFLNSGDALKYPDSLNKIFDKSGDRDFVYCDVEVFNGNKKYIKDHPDELTTQFLLTDMICHQAVFAKLEVFRKVGGFDETLKIYADYDWMLRAIKEHEVTTRHISRVLVRYEEVGASNTASTLLQRKEKDAIHDRYFGRTLIRLYRWYRAFNDWKDNVILE